MANDPREPGWRVALHKANAAPRCGASKAYWWFAMQSRGDGQRPLLSPWRKEYGSKDC
jgi:hypothetical protein